ncbi:MAG: SDR family NAD-dependent epimerase/dehydratase, partial [Deltaproteobacteria bacterium]|nr:SDR family NAD-dependent epimerase/dehydratase [Deltaproteobacteria bacterium]
VNDLVEGIIKLLFSQETEPVNLGNADEFSIVDFAQEVLEITGSKSRIVYQPLPVDDPRVRQPDITKAQKILNWNPQVGLREGIRKTVPYFQKKMA